MPDFNAWLGNTAPLAEWLNDWDRSTDVARLIDAKPTTITVIPVDSREVEPQVVRVEALSDFATRQKSPGTEQSVLRVLVIGYKNHATIEDSDLKRGDRFSTEGQLFEIVLIQPGFTDRLMALAEVR